MININFESQMVIRTIPQSIYLLSQIGQQNFRSNINNGMKLHPLSPSPSHGSTSLPSTLLRDRKRSRTVTVLSLSKDEEGDQGSEVERITFFLSGKTKPYAEANILEDLLKPTNIKLASSKDYILKCGLLAGPAPRIQYLT